MGITDRASGITSQTNSWMNQGGLATVVKRGLVGGPLAGVGLALMAGINTVASGTFKVIDAMFAIGANLFMSFASVIGIIPAGAQVSKGALGSWGILGVLVAVMLVMGAVYEFDWSRQHLLGGFDLPISEINIPYLGDNKQEAKNEEEA